MALKWYGTTLKKKVKADAGHRMDIAARTLRDYIRVQLSVPNAIITTTKSGKTKVKARSRGKNPSLPGEYPHKLYGQLRRNVSSEYDPTLMEARVGTNIPYGKYLELGTRKMRPRPWLSRGLQEMTTQLKAILSGGK